MFDIKVSYSARLDGNMDYRFGVPDAVKQNRYRFFQKHGIDPSRLTIMKVDHKDNLLPVNENYYQKGVFSDDGPVVDCLVGRVGVDLLGLLTADCLPLTISSQTSPLFALVHLSRHNLCGSLLSNAIKAINPGDDFPVTIKLGPYIHESSYVFSSISFDRLSGLSWRTVGSDQVVVDLRQTLINQLNRTGVDYLLDESMATDTFKGNFYSHREAHADQSPEARFLTISG